MKVEFIGSVYINYLVTHACTYNILLHVLHIICCTSYNTSPCMGYIILNLLAILIFYWHKKRPCGKERVVCQ